MYKIVATNRFKKDLKQIIKRGYNINLLEEVVNLIAKGDKLPQKYKDHALNGIFNNCRECHITSDWLLIYEISEDELLLYLTRTGTHSDLFKDQEQKEG